VLSAVSIVLRVVADLIGWFALAFRSRRSLQAEVLFLRRQLALYVERGVKPRRIGAATRVSLTMLSRLFKWQSALVVVRPQTLIRWHRPASGSSGGGSLAPDGRQSRSSYGS
jgi:putative transposase